MHTYIILNQPSHSALLILQALILESVKPAYNVLPSADQAKDKHSGVFPLVTSSESKFGPNVTDGVTTLSYIKSQILISFSVPTTTH